MMHVADWAHAAYQAARNRDRDAVLGVIAEIVESGTETVEGVSGLWIDRTLTVMNECVDLTIPTNVRLKVDVEPDDSAGPATGIYLAPPSVRWAGALFTARACGNDDTWNNLWKHTPTDIETLTECLRVLVGTMALTALAYDEDYAAASDDEHDADAEEQAEEYCCTFHQITSHVGPMQVGDNVAVAHLN